MNTQVSQNEIKKYVDIIWRRRLLLLIIAASVTGLAAAVAVLLPAVYRSNAVILIEQQEIPSELVRSTVTSFADQRIQVISQRVMTSDNLNRIINQYDLYAAERKSQPREAILLEMREDIALDMISADVVDPRSGRPTQATIAFSLSYDSKVPTLAQKVTSELVTLYLNENLKERTEAAEETSKFLTDESERLEREVEALERQLGEFKEQNVDQLPEIANLNRELLNRTESQFEETERRMLNARERIVYLEAEIAQVNPYTVLKTARGERVLGPEDRLQLLKMDLSAMRARYGDAHPDVITMSKQVSVLEEEIEAESSQGAAAAELQSARQELTTLLKQYTADHPDVKKVQRRIAAAETALASADTARGSGVRTGTPDNPAYIQLKSQIAAARQEFLTLQAKKVSLQEKINEFEQRIFNTPSVEQQYRAITRKYETTVLKHREIRNKQMEAKLSETLETERKGEKFTLIEPPLLPEEPDRPNRIAIFLVGLVLAFAGSLGSVGLVEAMDTRVRGRAGIQALVGVPPLAFIPNIQLEEQRSRLPSTNKAVAGGIVAIGVLALLVIHFAVMPLDVFWFVMLRKAGL